MNHKEETEQLKTEQAYRDMRGQELSEMPDLWNRIEAGFEEEKRQSGARKKLYRRRYLTLAAAALLIAVIAVPVITRTTRTGRNKSDTDNAAMESAEELSGDSMQSDAAQEDTEEEEISDAWEDSAAADMQTEESVENAETSEAATEAANDAVMDDSANTIMDMVSDGYDWDNMPFTIYGTSYRLSVMTYADIQAMGFEISEGYDNLELEEGQYTNMRTFAEAKDRSYMYIRFKNSAGSGTKNVKECEILGVTFYNDDFMNSYDVALGNGVAFDMTTDEVKAIMGEPADEYAGDEEEEYSMIYKESEEENANSVELTFKDGGLYEITMENYD